MKNLNVFLVLAWLLVGGCSKNDDVSERNEAPNPYILKALIGSWAYDSITFDGVTYSYEHTEGCVKDLFEFYNQEGKEFDFEEHVVSNCSNCAECALSSTNLEWELVGDTVNLYFGEQLVTSLEILQIDETVIRYKRLVDFDQDGTDDELIITGIPYDPYGRFD